MPFQSINLEEDQHYSVTHYEDIGWEWVGLGVFNGHQCATPFETSDDAINAAKEFLLLCLTQPLDRVKILVYRYGKSGDYYSATNMGEDSEEVRVPPSETTNFKIDCDGWNENRINDGEAIPVFISCEYWDQWLQFDKKNN